MADSIDAITNHERETWDRCAEIFEDNLAPLTRQGYQLILDTGRIASGMRVLDIGCGPGNFTAAYAGLGADVVGIDLAPQMVRVATGHYPDIEFRAARAEELPFDDESFDVVVAGYVVHHLASPEDAFGEVRRVLKPGGRFIFVIPVQESQSSFGAFISALTEHHTREVPGGPLLLETDSSVHERMLAESGFGECQVEQREVTCHLQSLDLVIKGCWEIAKLSDLPREIQAKIEASTRQNAEPYRNDDGTYTFPDGVLLGMAVK